MSTALGCGGPPEWRGTIRYFQCKEGHTGGCRRGARQAYHSDRQGQHCPVWSFLPAARSVAGQPLGDRDAQVARLKQQPVPAARRELPDVAA